MINEHVAASAEVQLASEGKNTVSAFWNYSRRVFGVNSRQVIYLEALAKRFVKGMNHELLINREDMLLVLERMHFDRDASES
tara:strand:- start:381 stop:626 length:246 start_codon:yes stop_codon:yes gene_type:complete